MALAAGSATGAQEDLSDEALRVEAEFARSAMNTAFGFGSLWVANGFKVVRLDASTGEITEIDLDGASQKQRKIAIGEGAVWVVSADGFEKTLVRLDAGSGKEQASIALPNAGVGVAFGFGSAWVTSGMGDALCRVDADSHVVTAELEIGDGPLFVAVGEDSVWVHIQSDASVVRVDGTSGIVLAKIETGLPSGAADIEIGGGYLWMNTPYTVSLAQIDPTSNSLIRKFSGAQGADAVDFGDDALWISGRSIKKTELPR